MSLFLFIAYLIYSYLALLNLIISNTPIIERGKSKPKRVFLACLEIPGVAPQPVVTRRLYEKIFPSHPPMDSQTLRNYLPPTAYHRHDVHEQALFRPDSQLVA